MKLSEMNTIKHKKINTVMESRFGFAIDYDNLTVAKAERLSEALTANLDKIRKSVGIHTAEKNPQYMELLMVREGLNSWMNDREIIAESEMAKSEVILAAKDVVDSVQDMLEKISKIQTEQMPALVDAIRDQIGTEQAESYKGQVGGVLTSLLEQLTQARETTDIAARGLAGEQTEQPMDLGGGDLGADLGAAPGGESDFDQEETDGFAGTDAAAGGEEEVGRERR